MFATGKGVMRTVYLEANARVDIIPADIVINVIIAAAWKTATTTNERYKLPVYNCVMDRNAITWAKFMKIGMRKWIANPLDDPLWYTIISHSRSKFVYNIRSFFMHLIPAIIIDIFRILSAKKPMYGCHYI